MVIVMVMVIKVHSLIFYSLILGWSGHFVERELLKMIKNTGPIDSDTSLIDKDQLREIE